MQRIARPLGARPNKPKHTASTGSTTALNIPSTDVGYEQSLIVSNITGSYVAIIKQEVDNAWVELDSREITATGLYTLEFTPTTTNVKLDIINTNTGSYTHALRLTGPAGWKDKDVLPLARTYTICDRPRDSYRFGFNGKEKDNEFAGIGNHVDFGARGFDTRIAKFKSIDPLYMKYPSQSPFNISLNNPLYLLDNDGRDAKAYIGEDGKLYIHATYFAVTEGATRYSDVEITQVQRALDNYYAIAEGMTINIHGKKVVVGGIKIDVVRGGDLDNVIAKANAQSDGNVLSKKSEIEIRQISGPNVAAITTSDHSEKGHKKTTYLNSNKLGKFTVGDEARKDNNAIVDESAHILGTDHPLERKKTGFSKEKYDKYKEKFGSLEKGEIGANGELKLNEKDVENMLNSPEMDSQLPKELYEK